MFTGKMSSCGRSGRVWGGEYPRAASRSCAAPRLHAECMQAYIITTLSSSTGKTRETSMCWQFVWTLLMCLRPWQEISFKFPPNQIIGGRSILILKLSLGHPQDINPNVQEVCIKY